MLLRVRFDDDRPVEADTAAEDTLTSLLQLALPRALRHITQHSATMFELLNVQIVHFQYWLEFVACIVREEETGELDWVLISSPEGSILITRRLLPDEPFLPLLWLELLLLTPLRCLCLLLLALLLLLACLATGDEPPVRSMTLLGENDELRVLVLELAFGSLGVDVLDELWAGLTLRFFIPLALFVVGFLLTIRVADDMPASAALRLLTELSTSSTIPKEVNVRTHTLLRKVGQD